MGAGFTSSGQTGSTPPSVGYDPNSINNMAASGQNVGGGTQSYVNPNQPMMGGFNQSFPMMPFQPLYGSKGYMPTQQPPSMMPNYAYHDFLQRMGVNPFSAQTPSAYARGGRVLPDDDPVKIAGKIARDKLREK